MKRLKTRAFLLAVGSLVCASSRAQSVPQREQPPPEIRVASHWQARGSNHGAFTARRNAQTGSAGAAWTSIGPQQESTAAYGPVTGRITSIAIDPADKSGNTVYAGTTGGGVWKSTNAAVGAYGGVSFKPLTDALPAYNNQSTISLSIGALTVQPGGTGVVLAGTGDPNDALDSYYGAGILRSDNNGASWSLDSRSNDSFNSSSRNFSFLGLAVAGFAWGTSNPNFVIAAVGDALEGDVVNAAVDGYSTMGLYYSTDAGNTWYLSTIEDGPNQILQSSIQEFYSGGNAVTSVVWNPVRQQFYAAIRFHGYYQSPDGITWTRMANQPGTSLNPLICPTNPGGTGSPSCPIYRGSLAVQPVTGDLYAWTVDFNNRDQGLWRDICSEVGGNCASNTVTFAQQIDSTALEAGAGDITVPQGDYNLTLEAVPSQQDTILFAGTTDVYRASLANSFAWRNTTNVNTCAAAKVAPSNHVIAANLDPVTGMLNGPLYFGNDGGLWRSTDVVNQQQPPCSSDDSSHYQNLNGGLGSLAEVGSFSGDPGNSGLLMASLGVLGTASPGQNTGQIEWPQVLDGLGNRSAIDPVNTENWYASSGAGVNIDRCSSGPACLQQGFGSPVIGSTQTGGDGDQLLLPAAWILDPQDSSQMIVGTCRVWRGPGTGGAGWSTANVLSPMLDGDQQSFCNGNAQIRSMAATGSATDPAGAPERIYAGMAGVNDGGEPTPGGGGGAPGHLFMAQISSQQNALPTWTDLWKNPVTNDQSNRGQFNPDGFDISSIYTDPHDPTGDTVYATLEAFPNNGYSTPLVYRSVDAGAHWANISNDLPAAPVNSVVVDPNNANTVYVAQDVGVYVTTNIASCSDPTQNCWSSYGTGLPKSPVTALRVFNQGIVQVLQAATYGRGLWETPLISAGQSTATAAFTGAQSLTFQDQAVQTTSAAQNLTLQNTGVAPLTITQVTASGDFAEQDNCSTPVTTASDCIIQVTFTPTVVGPRTGMLTIFANVPGGQIAAALTGTGTPAGALVLTPSALSFGNVLNGTTAPAQYLTISNTGTVPITLEAPAVTGDFALSANTCGSSLAPNYGCTVGITFTPSISGARSGVFSITGSAGTQTAALAGTGLAPPTDVLSTQSLAYAPLTVGLVSVPQQVMVTNTGGEALTEIAVSTTGDFAATNNCGTTLAGGLSCAISVAYTPQSVGSETGTLTIADVLHTRTIALSGTGLAVQGLVSAAPQQVSFGSQGVGSASQPQFVTLTNNGTIALTGLVYRVTGNYSLSNDCGNTLTVGANCRIGVVFSPTAAGTLTGTMTVSGGNLTSSLSTSLTGIGEDFALSLQGAPSQVVVSGQSATYLFQIMPVAGSSGTVTFGCSGAPANAACSVNPSSQLLQSGVTGSITVTVATGAGTSSAVRRSSRRGIGRRGGIALACLVPLLCLRRRTRRVWIAAAVSAALLLLPAACGVSSSSGGSSGEAGGPAGSTAAGTYTITLTGSVPGVEHNATAALIVQ